MTFARGLTSAILGLGLLTGLTACGDSAAPPQQAHNLPAPAVAPSSAPTSSESSAAVAAPPIQAEQGETRPRHRHRNGSRFDRTERSNRADGGDRAGRAGRMGGADRDERRVGAAFAAGPVALAEAQREKLHGRLVEFDGRVTKILGDDRRGLQHQRFIVSAEGAGTILIAHNIDLAGHVPVTVGETVRVHGLFEWTAKGGVVHWTHHDPSGNTPGGWIRCAGKTYS